MSKDEAKAAWPAPRLLWTAVSQGDLAQTSAGIKRRVCCPEQAFQIQTRSKVCPGRRNQRRARRALLAAAGPRVATRPGIARGRRRGPNRSGTRFCRSGAQEAA